MCISLHHVLKSIAVCLIWLCWFSAAYWQDIANGVGLDVVVVAVQQETIPEDNYHGKQALSKIMASILSRGGENVERKLVSVISIKICVSLFAGTHTHAQHKVVIMTL